MTNRSKHLVRKVQGNALQVNTIMSAAPEQALELTLELPLYGLTPLGVVGLRGLWRGRLLFVEYFVIYVEKMLTGICHII